MLKVSMGEYLCHAVTVRGALKIPQHCSGSPSKYMTMKFKDIFLVGTLCFKRIHFD